MAGGVTMGARHVGNAPSDITRRGFLTLSVGAVTCLGLGAFAGAGETSEKTVVIYSCGEGIRNETQMTALREAFPDYDIRMHYITTGNCAARLRMEGTASEADIVMDLEGGYINQVSDSLEVLSDFDESIFCEDLRDPEDRYFPFSRESACVATNDDVLSERGIPTPTSYQDLLDPVYAGVVCMPNPKTSGTGYNFLKSLVNAWGEDAAFDYFDSLANNVYQFTSSGSGPVNALVQGEAGVGFGMTYHAVSEINEGAPLSVHFFEEGSPWDVYGSGIIKGHGGRKAVHDVFGWLCTEGVRLDNETYVPDQVLVGVTPEIANYPKDITYADMTGITDVDEKMRLIERWSH